MMKHHKKYEQIDVKEYANGLGSGGCKNKNPFALYITIPFMVYIGIYIINFYTII